MATATLMPHSKSALDDIQHNVLKATQHSQLSDIELKINELKLFCCIDFKQFSQITFESQTHLALHSILKTIPRAEQKKNLETIAQLANFIFFGESYKYIEDIKKFQKEYQAQIALENDSFDLPKSITAFGIFNVQTMTPPKIIDNKIIFYVKDKTSIPYRVSFHCPDFNNGINSNEDLDIHRELLPYSEVFSS